jgi:hypothetical protein
MDNVINTYTTTQAGLNAADTLLVTNSGSIVVKGEDAVSVLGDNVSMVIDGLVSSTFSDGIHLFELFGITTTNNVVEVGSQGVVNGTIFGIQFEDPGNGAESNERVFNAGNIFGSSAAVSASHCGGDTFNNSGVMSGSTGIFFADNVAGETIENSGTIEGSTGFAIASSSSAASVGISVVNSGSGLLTNAGANPVGGGVLNFNDGAGTTSTINNEATITGAGYVIQSASDILDISNSGTIHGGLYSTASVSVDNSGLWQASAGGNGFLLNGSSNSVTNAQAGTISCDITFGGANDTVDNSGAIHGAVTLVAGGDSFTNSGNINGAITFTGAGANNALTNSGSVTGNVTLAGPTSALTNHGQIYGNVALADSDTLTNTGTIHGNETLGALNTIDNSLGVVTGVITASNSDTFVYSGRFGVETIDNFTAGSVGSGCNPALRRRRSRVNLCRRQRLARADSAGLVAARVPATTSSSSQPTTSAPSKMFVTTWSRSGRTR